MSEDKKKSHCVNINARVKATIKSVGCARREASKRARRVQLLIKRVCDTIVSRVIRTDRSPPRTLRFINRSRRR